MSEEGFKKKCDKTFQKYREAKSIEKQFEILTEFFNSLTPEEYSFLNSEFIPGAERFIDCYNEVERELKTANIETTHDNIIKGLDNKIYGYDIDGFNIPETESEEKRIEV